LGQDPGSWLLICSAWSPSGVFGWLVLMGRGQASKNAEIMVLCHEVRCSAVRQPFPSWAERAVLAALARLLPAVLRAHRMVVLMFSPRLLFDLHVTAP
jgi:hypothetical protein